MSEIQVLHVDDEPDMRLLVKLSLDLDVGISTRSASSGTEALDATTYWKPDVILLDAIMPGMDGLATLQALQTNPKTAGIPVLFLTGKCTASDIDSFKASGSAGVIAKPFDPQALAAAIRGYVQETTIAPAAVPGSAPDFAGRAPEQASALALPLGVANTLGATTEALLLDGDGNAFALTITDHAPGWSGSAALPAANWGQAMPLDAAAGSTAPAFSVHVTPLDAATVSDILGMDVGSLLNGDDHPASPPASPLDGATFAIGHASGWTPPGGVVDLSILDRSEAGSDALHHLGSISPSGDWAALILPRAAMH